MRFAGLVVYENSHIFRGGVFCETVVYFKVYISVKPEDAINYSEKIEVYQRLKSCTSLCNHELRMSVAANLSQEEMTCAHHGYVFMVMKETKYTNPLFSRRVWTNCPELRSYLI